MIAFLFKVTACFPCRNYNHDDFLLDMWICVDKQFVMMQIFINDVLKVLKNINCRRIFKVIHERPEIFHFLYLSRDTWYRL